MEFGLKRIPRGRLRHKPAPSLLALKALLTACVLALFLLAPPAGLSAPQGDNETIIAAVPEHFPPHYMTDETGRATGFAIDIMNHLAKRTGLNIRYDIYKNWTLVHDALRTGKADLIPNIGITQRRSDFLEFTAPIETFKISFFVRSASTDLETLEDLQGKVIGAIMVNAGYTILKDFGSHKIILVKSPQDLLSLLISGQADAIIYPEPLIWRLARLLDIEDRIRTIGPPQKEIKRGIGVARGRTELLTRLDSAIHDFVKSKDYNAIYTKWYGKHESAIASKRLVTTMFSIMVVFGIAMVFWKYFGTRETNKRLKESIAEREAAQQALAERERQYRLVVENLHEGIWLVDPDRHTLYANPRMFELLGVKQSQLLQSTADDYLPEEHRADFLGNLLIIKNTLPISTETQLVRQDGEVLDVMMSLAPVSDEHGTYTATLLSIMDITESTRLRAELEEANKQAQLASRVKSEFVGVMSHEIRMPLNGLLSMLQMLERTRLSAEQIEPTTLARRAGNGLLTVLNDIFDISMMQSPITGILHDRFTLPAIITTVVDSFVSEAKVKGIEIRTNIADTATGSVIGDARRIRQILFNLLGNAIKFTEHGTVDIEVSPLPYRPDGKHQVILFVITDTGIGFSDDRVDTCFEPRPATLPFTPAGQSPPEMGFGIIRQMVESLGGTLAVDSEETVGTAIYFTIQVELPDSAAPQGPPDSSADRKASSRMTRQQVLIVGDDQVNHFALERPLGHMGYSPIRVSNHAEALQALRAHSFAFILLVAGPSASESLEALRALQEVTPSPPPIIGILQRDASAQHSILMDNGIAGTITYPMPPEALQDMINSLLARARNGGT